MITRRNWLLRCSILINIAVLLYICSHVMIGSGNMTLGPAFIIQEDFAKPQQLRQHAVTSLLQGMETASNYDQPSSEKETLQIAIAAVKSQHSNAIDDEKPQEQQTYAKDVPVILDDNQYIVPSEGPLADSMGQQQPQPSQSQQQQQRQQQQQQQQKQQQSQSQAPQSQQTSQTVKSAGSGSGTGSGNSAVSSSNDAVFQETGFVNSSTNEAFTLQNQDDKDLETRLKLLISCHNKGYGPETVQRGDFWVLKNYVRADHGELRCLETITYTTHADYTFLDNLIPLLERWNAPVSIALHAPGTDFIPTIKAIKYLRDCTPEGALVRQFTTFHIYFSSKHIPKIVPKFDKVMDLALNCSLPPTFANVSTSQLYKTQKKLLYPVNVGRNIARDAAMTHFILASDIELYPNPGLTRKFLEMVARNDVQLQRKNPKVFPLSIFEVDATSQVPRDKTELQELLRTGKAIPFHKRVCSSCHGVPKSKEWMAANETEELGIFHIGKRVGYFVHWEPIYIGTHADPRYDERLSWEGKSDKMTQGYALCALDYEFHILDNAFLVHKPGIKVLKKDPKRAMLAAKTNQLIKKIIYPELQVMYGTRKGCAV